MIPAIIHGHGVLENFPTALSLSPQFDGSLQTFCFYHRVGTVGQGKNN